MAYVDAVFDRTATDITNKTAKAFMNVADWTRIRGNILECISIINSLPSVYNTPISTYTIITVTNATIPTVANVNAIVESIRSLRSAYTYNIINYADLVTFVGGKNGTTPNYQDVNKWEKNLYILYYKILGDWTVTRRCGEIATGGTDLI